MNNQNEIPLFECVIDENDFETGVNFVALVGKPAIERNFHIFNESKKHQFQINDERRIVSGPLMIPNLPIFRHDEKTGPYYVTFSESTIEKIAMKFMKNGFGKNVNMQHKTPVDGVYMFETFLIDGKRGINPPTAMNDLPHGTWFGSYKIENDDVWENKVKTGEFRGFSVEGAFDELFVLKQNQFQSMSMVDEILELLK
jgi:hypothetical protein